MVTVSAKDLKSDIFVRDLRFLRDRDYGANRRFLEALRTAKNGVTTLYNLLEVCGILSFNLNSQQLKELLLFSSTVCSRGSS